MNPTHQRPGKKAVLARFYGSMDDEYRRRKRHILIASGILITIVLGYCGYRLLWNYQNRLYLAIVAHDLDGVTRAIQEGIDVNGELWDENTPLICAAGHGNVDIAKTLLDAGADVNRYNNGKWDTPLAQAASSGDLTMTTMLIQRGADVNQKIHEGIGDTWEKTLTPLMLAAWCNKIDVVRALIEAGADVNLRTPRGTSALDLAVRDHRREMIDLLIAAGAR